jgi:3,4-dihydroxy 2-butanone 4-phosphate synthase/GTP cyclohydrolase II
VEDVPDRTEALFNSVYGRFRIIAVQSGSGDEHAALVAGRPEEDELPLVRIQSACVTGTALGALLCDCRQQVELALQTIAAEGGVFLYLDQEGRGHGLVEKVAHFAEMNKGVDTWEAAIRRGVDPDLRDYADASAVVKSIVGDRPVRLLTNNPEKIDGVRKAGLEVAARVALEPEPTETNRGYLRSKKERMGHLLERV